MGTHLRAIVVKVSYQVPSIQNEAPYQRRYRRRATRWRINRRSREGRNEVPAVNQSPTKKYGLEQKVQTCTQTFRTNLALEKGRSCVKSGRRGSWRYANFGRWSTSEAALTANHLQEVWVREQKVQTCTQSFRTNLALEKGRSCVKSGRRESCRCKLREAEHQPAKQPSIM